MDTAVYVTFSGRQNIEASSISKIQKHTGTEDLEVYFHPHPHRLIPKFWMYE